MRFQKLIAIKTTSDIKKSDLEIYINNLKFYLDGK